METALDLLSATLVATGKQQDHISENFA